MVRVRVRLRLRVRVRVRVSKRSVRSHFVATAGVKRLERPSGVVGMRLPPIMSPGG